MKSTKTLAICVLVLVLGGGSTWALDWFVDIVDGEYPDSEVGMWTNVVCDSQDRPRCSYYEGDDNCLKYAAWNGTSWDREVVDEGGPTDPFSVGRYNCMVIDSQDRCHISYRDRNKFRLKYAVQNGSGGWDFQVVDDPNATDPVGDGKVGVGRYTSIDLDSNEYPHISYVDLDNGCLKYARWNGSSWEVENVYCTGIYRSITGTSIQIDSNDHPHIAFGDTSITDGGMVASWNGSTWTFVNIKYYMDVSTYMAIDPNDDLHITIGGSIYIRTKGSEWIKKSIPLTYGGGSSIKLDKNGYPRICHTGNNHIWYLYFNGTEWTDQCVDDSPEVGEERCIGLDSKGIPYITYFAQKFYNKQQIRIASIIPPKPDSDDDGYVDWSDLKVQADNWLWSGHPGANPGDISCDGTVQFVDLALLSARWREGCEPQASEPSPAHGAINAGANVVLGWKPGYDAVRHNVYLGTDFAEVNNASDVNTPPGRGQQDANRFDPPGFLELSRSYHWRIDELDGEHIWKGDVWSFTVTDHLVLDDMEDYTAEEPNRIHDTWHDWEHHGYDPVAGEFPTSAQLTIETADANVHGGKQSMKFEYNNSDSGAWAFYRNISEIDANTIGPMMYLEIGKDWTFLGVKVLTLYFIGHPDNDANEQMYVALADSVGRTAVVPYGYYDDEDMNDIKNEEWQEWNILLEDFNDINNVNVTDVNNVYIGFGNRDNPTVGGSGIVFFDDIRLHPPECVPDRGPVADLSGNCIVELEDFAILGNQWLQPPGSPSADISEPPDGVVNMLDLDS